MTHEPSDPDKVVPFPTRGVQTDRLESSRPIIYALRMYGHTRDPRYLPPEVATGLADWLDRVEALQRDIAKVLKE